MRARSIAVVGTTRNRTTRELVAAWQELGLSTRLVPAREAQAQVRAGSTLLGRLDVLPTLDGVDPGLLELLRLERRGARVLNRAFALLGAHDKLLTARLLVRAGVPHPRTVHVTAAGSALPLEVPIVVKPRFGSWGLDVFRCDSAAEARSCLASVANRPWFRRHGAIVQELVAPSGYDLRVIVAGGTVAGAIERHPRHGEWRTNTSLGATKHPARPDAAAVSLALSAATALGTDLAGVDLLPVGSDGYTVVELNGAADFDRAYDLDGGVYALAATALGLIDSPGEIGIA